MTCAINGCGKSGHGSQVEDDRESPTGLKAREAALSLRLFGWQRSCWQKSCWQRPHPGKAQFGKAQFDKAQFDKAQFGGAPFDEVPFDQAPFDDGADPPAFHCPCHIALSAGVAPATLPAFQSATPEAMEKGEMRL